MFNCAWIPVKKGADKICHLVVGFIIAIVVTLLSVPIYGVVAGVAAGVGKELVDYKSYGKFDFFDMFATIAGAVIGVMLLHLVFIFI